MTSPNRLYRPKTFLTSTGRLAHESIRRSIYEDRQSFLIYCLLLSGMLCTGGAFINGRPGMMLASLGTLVATYVVMVIGRMTLPNSVAFVALISIYAAQIAIQFLVALLNIQMLKHAADFGIFDHTGAITLSHLCLLAGSLVAAEVLSSFTDDRRSLAGDLGRNPTPRTKMYLVSALMLTVLGGVVPYALTGVAQYLSFVLTANLEGACFFVGWFSADMGLVGILCLAALLGNALIGGLLGTRYGIMLLALYFIGRLISKRERSRGRVLGLAAAVLVPALFVFSTIGNLRSSQGRGSLHLVDLSHLYTLIDSTFQAATGTGSDEPILDSLSRLYAWPNAAAVTLTPESVPYRGFAQWLSECKSYVAFWGDSEGGKEQALQNDTGTYHAQDYGFNSSLHSTSEFGVVADGWSTAGALGVCLFSFLVALGICGTERIIARYRISSGGSLVMLCVLCKISMMCYVYPVPIVLRTLLITTTMWGIIIKIADVFGSRTPAPSHRLRAGSSGYELM
jgi:hypothetical protein